MQYIISSNYTILQLLGPNVNYVGRDFYIDMKTPCTTYSVR